jgi:hypothetical protein
MKQTRIWNHNCEFLWNLVANFEAPERDKSTLSRPCRAHEHSFDTRCPLLSHQLLMVTTISKLFAATEKI